jgi:polysaccharide deacetylase family protein (PEP-CTERM system associated)
LLNALTIDLEDWYQGLEIGREHWSAFEDRIDLSGRKLLALLAEAGTRATFFVLGHVAERHPDLIREAATAGHEIATHGESHQFVYRMSTDSFRTEIRDAAERLRQLAGQPVFGHRAPFFSVTKASLWALDVLVELGFRYDSSVFPVRNYRYGIVDAPRWPYRTGGRDGRGLTEFPISTWRLFGTNVPIAGGAYFRIYPYAVTRMGLRSINRQGHPAVFYLHPWELDPGHPRVPVPRRISATHYFNLSATEGRLRRLLRDFRFAPMGEVLGVP